MNLSEYLLDRDVMDLKQMAQVYECECNRHSKLDLVQSIHYQMMNASRFQSLLAHVDEDYIRFITYLCWQGKRSFLWEELLAKGKFIANRSASTPSPRAWIAESIQRGWLFPAGAHYEQRYEIPVDVYSYLKRQFIQYWQATIPLQASEPCDQQTHKYVIDEGHAILDDVHFFVQFVQKEDVPLTLEGAMHKRIQQRLMDHMSVKEELLPQKTWRFGYGRRFPFYPNRMALIYDFSYFKKWIVEDGNRLRISAKGEAQLAANQIRTSSVWKDVLNYWLKTYQQPIPSFPFLFRITIDLMADQWVELEQIYSFVAPWLESYYYDDPPTIFRERLIQMGVHMGSFSVATNERGEYTYIKARNKDVLHSFVH